MQAGVLQAGRQVAPLPQPLLPLLPLPLLPLLPLPLLLLLLPVLLCKSKLRGNPVDPKGDLPSMGKSEDCLRLNALPRPQLLTSRNAFSKHQ